MLRTIAAITQNSKNILKLNLPLLAKSYEWFSKDFLKIETDFGRDYLLKTPLKLNYK